MFGNKTTKKPATSTASLTAMPTKSAVTVPITAPRMEDIAAPATTTAKNQNVIGKGTVIEGNVIADGDLRLEGTVRGDVSTKSTLTVGAGCIVEGNLMAQNAEIAGVVHGTVQTTDLLIIKSTGTIDGDVITTNLNVEAGSAFTGRFQVGPITAAEKPIKSAI